MAMLIGGIILLVIGYFTYGRLIEKLLKPDTRLTPAVKEPDGVDYVELPMWKNLLIQLLNIAGIGPVIGVIVGIKFGAKCFWIIPLGCILMGAVHDYVSGFMSLRSDGRNLTGLTRDALGKWYGRIFCGIVAVALLLVVAVFINVPANLINGMMPSAEIFWTAVGAIFLYYVIATIFPVDRIIGRVYPIFGALLLIGTIAMLGAVLFHVSGDPTLLTETEAFKQGMFSDQPVIPCLFVTIACGIISGFHATQSPIVARTMKAERQARATYYGMMIVEGIIAMIWAAAGMAIYNKFPELMAGNPNNALLKATTTFMGSWMGTVTVVSVIVLAVTSGDTALRSLRLTAAETFKVPQTKLCARIALCLPLMVIVAGLLWWSNLDKGSFSQLWRYFAWTNQILSASTLMACTVWMMRQGNKPWYTLLPGMFMTFVVSSFILWTDVKYAGCPYGFALPLPWAYGIAGAFTLLCAVLVLRLGRKPASAAVLEK